MAQLLSNGQIKKDDGTVVTPQEGGWYDARRYLGGQLLAPGQDQPGHNVSAEVIAQTNPTNVTYVQQKQKEAGMTPVSTTPAGGGGSPAPATTTPSGGSSTAASSVPSIDLNAMYTQLMSSPEITAAQKAYDDKQAEIDQLNEDLAAEKAKYSDDPYLATAMLTGKLKKLSDATDAKVANLNAEAAQAADTLAKLKADVQVKLNIANQQYNIDDQKYKDNLSRLNTLISTGAILGASGSDIANIATSTGLTTSMVQSIIDKAKAGDIKITTATNSAGDVTIIATDAKGNIVNKQVVSSAGKGAGATVGGAQGISNLKADVKAGMTLQQVIQKYVGILSNSEILQVYNTTSPYGPAKKTPEQINEMMGITAGVSFSKLSSDEQAAINALKDAIKNGLKTRDEVVAAFPQYAQYL